MKVGDLVKMDITGRRESKLDPKFDGPFVVSERPDPLHAVVKQPDNPATSSKVHVCRLERWFSPASALRGGGEEPADADAPADQVEDDSEQRQWEIKDITAMRRRGKRRWFRVRWVGYGPRFDEWVEECNLDAPDLIRRYLQSQPATSTSPPSTSTVDPSSDSAEDDTPVPMRSAAITRAGRVTRPPPRLRSDRSG